MSRSSKSIVPTITLAEYGGLETAFGHLNKVLFGEQLPEVLITLQRQAHSNGYFSPDRFTSRSGSNLTPEIALNPSAFTGRTDEQIVSTLAHEMVHLQQETYGKPSKRGYHNAEWASMMKAIGLMPSSTAAVGGKETGQRVSHYIIPNGAYQQVFEALAATGWRLNLQCRAYAGGAKALPSKVKFTCPQCLSNVWGKPETKDICGDCNVWRVAPDESVDIGSYEPQASVELATM